MVCALFLCVFDDWAMEWWCVELARALLVLVVCTEQTYRSMEQKLQSAAVALGYASASVQCIPISALSGANVLSPPAQG